MAKATRICKVCGKEYEYCKTWLSTNKFRYQDVACSPECGAKYFAKIEASRSEEKVDPKSVKAVDTVYKKQVKKVSDEGKDFTKEEKADVVDSASKSDKAE